jgi:alpha-ribazole phosphatase
VGDSEKPNRLLLARHGEVTTVGQLYGQLDVPLSDRGREQSVALRERLRAYRLDAVYASDLERTRWAADLIAHERGLVVHERAALRERMFGDWQGKTWEEIQEMSPVEYEAYRRDFLTAVVPGGGETYVNVRDRVMPVVHEMVGEGEGRHVLLIGHAGVLRVILAEALGMPLRNIFRIELDYTNLSIIDFHPNGRQVVKVING